MKTKMAKIRPINPGVTLRKGLELKKYLKVKQEILKSDYRPFRCFDMKFQLFRPV